MNDRTTNRRYAHELYPDPSEGFEPAALTKEVPHLYARALGLNVMQTSWSRVDHKIAMARTNDLVNARMIAALADAMEQGLTGDEAYAWAYGVASDEAGECVWDRAVEWGIDPYAIKPYLCGDEPEWHYHYGEPDKWGTRIGLSTPGKESRCDECTHSSVSEPSE